MAEGLFARIRRVVTSNINDMVSRAEDPEKMLNQLIIEMNQQLIESKKMVASSIADEKKLERQMNEQTRLGSEWEKKAMLALRAAEREPEKQEHYENLAKQALLRKKEHDANGTSYRNQWEQQHASVEQLKEALRGLQQKIEEAQRKKNLLIARQRRAEAQKRINEQIKGLSDTSAFDAFDRMTTKVDQIEAEADAVGELSDLTGSSSLESEFARLESSGGGDGDALLEDLKSRMALEDQSGGGKSGSGAKSKSGEKPAPDDGEVDSDLDSLKKKLADED